MIQEKLPTYGQNLVNRFSQNPEYALDLLKDSIDIANKTKEYIPLIAVMGYASQAFLRLENVEDDQNSFTITPQQIKAARALLDITQIDLAEGSELSVATIADYERGAARQLSMRSLNSIVEYLQSQGIRFINRGVYKERNN